MNYMETVENAWGKKKGMEKSVATPTTASAFLSPCNCAFQ